MLKHHCGLDGSKSLSGGLPQGVRHQTGGCMSFLQHIRSFLGGILQMAESMRRIINFAVSILSLFAIMAEFPRIAYDRG